jgi:secreted Zn-dependent insulinase-like peptidase
MKGVGKLSLVVGNMATAEMTHMVKVVINGYNRRMTQMIKVVIDGNRVLEANTDAATQMRKQMLQHKSETQVLKHKC